LDRLSNGRFEPGFDAGHTPQEYAATGIQFDAPSVRKARLMESVEVIRRLVDGETVCYDGDHLRVDGAKIDRSHQERLPILSSGNGSSLLEHAGAHAAVLQLDPLLDLVQDVWLDGVCG
jgi:alkanesulfonate monooxygenase SsuD/methylene tetrahydromethanopterin reductase-like flavin-dependent oxidoreductase (luciferase family)